MTDATLLRSVVDGNPMPVLITFNANKEDIDQSHATTNNRELRPYHNTKIEQN